MASSSILIKAINSPDDFTQIQRCASEAFGRQARDAIWLAHHPMWETSEGQQQGAAQFLKRWQNIKQDKYGRPNTVFLKATLPDPTNESKQKIVGMAIWQQASFVDGHGDPPSDNFGELNDLDPTEARFVTQAYRSLFKRRVELAREKVESEPPAIFMLDMCCVDPDFQRRGIAGRLVQWGLDEAKRRGNLECMTEASSMGRGAYMKLGFRPEGDGADIVYELDEEFDGHETPPNVFLRTGTIS